MKDKKYKENTVKVVFLGEIDYREALSLQKKLLKLRQADEIEDILLLLEHPPVLTLGKRGKQSNILVSKDLLRASGIKVYEIGRGGDITYHGPGQIVGYPIMNLNNYGRDIRKFVRNIEEIFIKLLDEEYNINAGRDPEHTGVWVGNDKITAIGLSIKRWVSMHGFAFNVNTRMEHFSYINACGISDKGVTSLEQLVGHPLDMEVLEEQVIQYFSYIFDVQIEKLDRDILTNLLIGSDKNEKT